MTRPTFTRYAWGAVFLALAVSGPASAQSSRVDAIATEQQEKAERLAPEQESRAEHVINQIFLPADPNGFFPFFASPFPGGGFSMGVGYQRHLPHAARAGIGVAWTVQNFKLVSGRFGMPLDRDQKFRFELAGRWVDAPTVPFYGLGSSSSLGDRADFGYRPSSASATLTAHPFTWVRLLGSYTFQNAATTDDGEVRARFGPAQTPGLGEDLAFNVYSGGIALDTRPSPSYADHGSLLRAQWWRFDETAGKPFSFDQTEFEAVQLIPIVRRYFVFALRGLATFTDPREGDTVPFMLAPHVGSGSTLRGFNNRRFQDRHRVVLTGEYRWQPSRYLDMAIFYDAGQVQAEKDQFRWRAFETAWGIGARFHTPVANVLRLEMAHSREGWVLVAGASQPF